jgi:hypothetical protein
MVRKSLGPAVVDVPLSPRQDSHMNVVEVSQSLALNLGLTDEQFNIWTEMEMVSFSVLLHCRKYSTPVASARVLTNLRDRCERSMFVARDEHEGAKIIACPLPDCNNVWCKHCQQTIVRGGPQHSCDGTTELDHLMKQQGWKYCPCMPVLACCHYRSPFFLACKTPIQKVSGCNHMLVRSYCNLSLIRRLVEHPPPCSVRPPHATRECYSHRVPDQVPDVESLTRHFCYLCGGLIVKSTLGREIKGATSRHFGSNCNLFEFPGE